MNAKTRVPGVRPDDRERESRALQLVPPDPVQQKAPRPRAQVAPQTTQRLGSVRPAREAWAKIGDPLRRRKGIRVLAFGITTKGKTHGVADFLDFVIDRNLVELLIIHDVKKREPQYEGEIIHEATDLYTHPPESYPARRVLRRRSLDHMPSVEGAARVTLESAYEDVTTMLVIDEFARALNEAGKYTAPSVERLVCEGADFGASFVGTKQLPQYTPTSAVAQSDLVIFGLNGKGASLLVGENYVPPAGGDMIEALEQRHFLLVPAEGNFDGHVYEVPTR
jgi:hypothetical protein